MPADPSAQTGVRCATRQLALGLLLAAAPVAAQEHTVVEVRDSQSEADDYLCWSPVPARIRLAQGGAGRDVVVEVSSERSRGGGDLLFLEAGAPLGAHGFAPKPIIQVTLNPDGAWKSFWVAGRAASSGGKDVRIEVKALDGRVLGSLPVMVRVRKNADALSDLEIGLFMSALETLKRAEPPKVNYDVFTHLHTRAARLGIHKSPLFLPWHRAFLLDFERRLQAIDPRVAVPYWAYDKPSTRIFTSAFMGVTEPGGDFQPGGVLESWAHPELGRLLRYPVNRPADGMAAGSIVDSFDPEYVHFQPQLESRFHNGVHSRMGGWIGSAASPADPLFFLLHANVDRVWARWQFKHGRFDASSEQAYSAQGAYPGSGVDSGFYPRGAYADDPMWPWAQGADGHWPSVTHAMPEGLAPAQGNVLTPSAQLDYMGAFDGVGLGYCYDDIDFLGRSTGPDL